MARARNIKPGFFTNDVLGELPPLCRLLFAGIWTLCDREGRLEDRPKKIRAEVLPYDECDCDALLEDLRTAGFIDRYQVGDVRVIQVLAWAKHQNPHVKEGASTLPARCESGASTVQEQCSTQPSPERAGLIPSSLIPDSLSSDSGSLNPDSREADSGESDAPEAKRTRAKVPSRPDDVQAQTWDDLLALRKAKHAPVTETMLSGARAEAEKAGISLQRFLEIWCIRGSQGLQASWLSPEERGLSPPVRGSGFQGNRQIALEQQNKQVGREWLAGYGINAGEVIDEEQ